MLPIRAYHRTDVCIFILESKNWTPTLRMTYIKTCFINILLQISSPYTVLTGGTKVAWLNTALHAWSTRHPWFWSTRANFPAVRGCYHLQRFALALCWWFLSLEQMMPRVSPTLCHLLPFAFIQPRSHSCSEATVAQSLLPLLWGHRSCCSGRGDSCRQGLPAIKPTAALLPHAEMLHKCLELNGNKYTDWFTAGKNSSLSSI